MNIINKILSKIAILPIQFYRYVISPYTPSSCRHIPTCSQYAIEALQVHGIFKGSILGIKRLSKCHPWGTEGFDPVPPKFDHKKIDVKKLKIKK